MKPEKNLEGPMLIPGVISVIDYLRLDSYYKKVIIEATKKALANKENPHIVGAILDGVIPKRYYSEENCPLPPMGICAESG